MKKLNETSNVEKKWKKTFISSVKSDIFVLQTNKEIMGNQKIWLQKLKLLEEMHQFPQHQRRTVNTSRLKEDLEQNSLKLLWNIWIYLVNTYS